MPDLYSEPAVKIQKVRKRQVKAFRETEFAELYAHLLGSHAATEALRAATEATPGIGPQRRLTLLVDRGLPLPQADEPRGRGRPRSEDLDAWQAAYLRERDRLLAVDQQTFTRSDADLEAVEMDVARVAWRRAMVEIEVAAASARTRLRRMGLVVPTWPHRDDDPILRTPDVLLMSPGQVAIEQPWRRDRRMVTRVREGRASEAEILARWGEEFKAAPQEAAIRQMYGGANYRPDGQVGRGGGRRSVQRTLAEQAARGQ